MRGTDTSPCWYAWCSIGLSSNVCACIAGISDGLGGAPVEMWRRSGFPDASNYHLGPRSAVLLVASMALAKAHWFSDDLVQPHQARAYGGRYSCP